MLNTENGPYVWTYWYFLKNCHKPSVSKDHFSSSVMIAQLNVTIAQYFHKVKLIRSEILELVSIVALRESRIKRIIVHSLRP